MFFYIYQILIYFIQPILLLRLFWRSLKSIDYRKRLNERYGFYTKKIISGGILIHSVSIGEVLSAVPLIKALHYKYPQFPIIITTTTPSGAKIVLSKLGNIIQHIYLPYDLQGSIKRFLNKTKPKIIIIMEKEFWPNLFFYSKKYKIPLIIANAHLSLYSTLRYQLISKFIKSLLQNITFIAAQSNNDGKYLMQLGFPKNKLHIIGNLKFDITIDLKLIINIVKLRQLWAPQRKVWIASSTHKGEESIILQTHYELLKQFPNLLLIIVPRHPERFIKIKKIIKKYKLNYINRSTKYIPDINIQVIIGDSIGELILLYGVADLAFIGGSLIKQGGHNPLEAAIHGIPILMGPYIFNFEDICDKLKQAEGLIKVYNYKSMISKISFLLKNNKSRLFHGRQALKVLHQNQGTLYKLLKLLHPYLIS